MALLADGMQTAGYHSAVLDGAGLASGIYFARFTATDGSGMVKHTAVSKLILIR